MAKINTLIKYYKKIFSAFYVRGRMSQLPLPTLMHNKKIGNRG